MRQCRFIDRNKCASLVGMLTAKGAVYAWEFSILFNFTVYLKQF